MNAKPSDATDVDVLISGYGPTGATLANLLGRRGHRVLVIDQAATIYDKPRAITADHEVFRVLQECGIAQEIAETTTPHPGTDYVGLQGQTIKRFYPAPPPNALGWEPSWMFVQPDLEAHMRKAVDKLPQVRSWLSHQLLDFAQDGKQVSARIRRLNDGSETTVRARYLVAADGASSLVRKQLASPIEDLAFDEWWVVVDAWINGPIDLPERCVQYCRPTRPGTYIVGPGTLRRWEIKLLPHEDPAHYRDHHEAVWRMLGEFADTRSLEHCRTAVYRFHALVVQEWRQGRVFLAGDAAHQMPPFWGKACAQACATPATWSGSSTPCCAVRPTIACWRATPPNAKNMCAPWWAMPNRLASSSVNSTSTRRASATVCSKKNCVRAAPRRSASVSSRAWRWA